MDEYAYKHLDRWLKAHVPDDERDALRERIVGFCNEYPDVLARGDGWPEVRNLVERRWPVK